MNKELDKVKTEFLNKLISLGMGYEFTTALYDDGNWIKLSFWYLGTNYSELGCVMTLRIDGDYDESHIYIFKRSIEALNDI